MPELAKSIVVSHCPTCKAEWHSVPIYTKTTVKKHGLMQLTQWVQPGEKIVRTWKYPTRGEDFIFAGDWLKREAARIIRTPGRTAALVVNTKTGEQALFVNRIAGTPADDDDEGESPLPC